MNMLTKRTHIFTGSVYEQQVGYARAVIVGEQIYLSGTVGIDFATGQMPEGPEAQTATALDTIENVLLKANSGLQDIVRARVYVPNREHVMRVSAVLKNRIGFTYPTNTTICSPLAVPGALVEIEVEAIRGSGEPCQSSDNP